MDRNKASLKVHRGGMPPTNPSLVDLFVVNKILKVQTSLLLPI